MATLLALAALLCAPAPAQAPGALEAAQPAARALFAGREEPVLADDRDEGPALAGDLPNFHEVEPGLYRLAQPTAEGVRLLATRYGVKTILNLRLSVPKAEAAAARAAKITIHGVKMNGLLLPRFHEMDAALEVLRTAPRPAAVHCLHGRDRTGVVVAAYEVVVRGRQAAAAAEEAKTIGCCPPTFVVPLTEYLERYRRHAQGDATALEPQDPLRR